MAWGNKVRTRFSDTQDMDSLRHAEWSIHAWMTEWRPPPIKGS